VDTDSRWDSDARNRQTPDSSAAAAGTAAQAVPEAGIAAGLEEGSAVAAVRAGVHIVVSQAEGRNDVVAGYARPRMVEAGSAAVVVAVVVVGGRGEMKAVVGRIGRLEGAQSTVVDLVGLEAEGSNCRLAVVSLGILTSCYSYSLQIQALSFSSKVTMRGATSINKGNGSRGGYHSRSPSRSCT